MDGREGMPSFYLDREFRGLSSNGGSGNPGSGFHPPPPGFKTQSNPSLSPHCHSNMRVASSMPSSFHLEHSPTPTPASAPIFHGINLGVGGVSSDDDGGAGSITKPVGGNESAVKKKRGRSRKDAPEPEGSHMALALTSDPTTPMLQKKRGRPPGSGRKQLLANVGEWMHNSAGSAFMPHIIHISVGEDVAEKVLSFAQHRQRALCILSGNGSVSAVTLRLLTPSGGTMTYEGRFEILCLSGSYLLAEPGSPHNRTGSLSISLCNSDGEVIGGAIGGKLVASTMVQVVVCSFLYDGVDNSKRKTQIEPPSGDEKSRGAQLN